MIREILIKMCMFYDSTRNEKWGFCLLNSDYMTFLFLFLDPIKTAQGSLSLKAYRLTPKLMEICKEKDFTPEGWVVSLLNTEKDATTATVLITDAVSYVSFLHLHVCWNIWACIAQDMTHSLNFWPFLSFNSVYSVNANAASCIHRGDI